ncbi:GntR family transcriptional regulator [Phyllobacterium myrsinacearum]|uniref:DNA-binding GntR family transcriptional regulator n=1 Tax=Phyllobacterium myrsinacearum TaxID=28101 RepID=A0A839EUC7_9HYPH|nr:GntR family transcriptional regulator [Phyllobacterium myrsinacearum]MBA8880946.1 DNA-binding GntR family transcriptional regulator [Phyllobacterium myrsinacearum]
MTEAGYRKPGVEILPLSKETLQDKVYRQITNLILEGSIVPGEMVTVQSLADAFGVSAMPVREALRRLTAANALTVVSGRSIGIPPLSHAKLTDLRDVRSEVEAIAGAWAAKRIGNDEIEALRLLLDTLEKANAASDVKSYLHANHAFHFSIYRASGSESILNIIENLWLQVSPYFNMLHDSGNYTTANTHHQAMFDALCARDENAIKIAIKADIEAAYDVLAELMN